MKRFATIGAMCLLVAIATPVFGDTWNGAVDSNWSTCSSGVDNWDSAGCDYPGETGTGDSATFAVVSSPTVNLGVALNDLSTVFIDAQTPNTTRTLNVNASGAFDTSGLVTVKAKTAIGPAKYANLNVVNTTDNAFGPAALSFEGNTNPSKGHATFDMAADVTVGGISGSDVVVRGVVDFSLASGVVFDAVQMELIDSASADLQVTGAGSTDTRLQYDSITMNDGAFEIIGPITVREYD